MSISSIASLNIKVLVSTLAVAYTSSKAAKDYHDSLFLEENQNIKELPKLENWKAKEERKGWN